MHVPLRGGRQARNAQAVVTYPRPNLRPFALELAAGDGQPTSWTSRHQASTAKYTLGCGMVGGLGLVATASHCAHPVLLLLNWLVGL